jgi:hypothetical protein
MKRRLPDDSSVELKCNRSSNVRRQSQSNYGMYVLSLCDAKRRRFETSRGSVSSAASVISNRPLVLADGYNGSFISPKMRWGLQLWSPHRMAVECEVILNWFVDILAPKGWYTIVAATSIKYSKVHNNQKGKFYGSGRLLPSHPNCESVSHATLNWLYHSRHVTSNVGYHQGSHVTGTIKTPRSEFVTWYCG